MTEGVDFFVYLVDFPVGAGCDGMSILNDDGTYSVYINARAGYSAQRKAMCHEYEHMVKGDLHGSADICNIEEALLCQRN